MNGMCLQVKKKIKDILAVTNFWDSKQISLDGIQADRMYVIIY